MLNFSKTVYIVALLSILMIFAITVVGASRGELELSAKSWVLLEPQTQTVISGSNYNKRMPMASTTKIMTAIVACERLKENRPFKVPREAVGIEGSSIYLCEGDEIYTDDLLYSLLLQSANDAAVALAIASCGSVDGFCALMNEKACELGLTYTHFDNPHGLDSQTHYTTAKELALIAKCALDNEKIADIISQKSHSFYLNDKRRVVLNHNKLLWKYDGCNGVKTGYTKKSGRCLVSSAMREGLELIAVTLSAPNDWCDHQSLLDYGFSVYERRRLTDYISELPQIPIIGSKTQALSLKIAQNGAVTSLDGISFPSKITSKTKVTLSLPLYKIAGIDEGEHIGELLIYEDDLLSFKYDIIAAHAVKANKRKA